MSPIRRRLAVGIAAPAAIALGLGLRWTAHADTETAASGCQAASEMYEVCLTNPDKYEDGADLTIVDRLREYVQSAEADSVVHGAMFLWELCADGDQDCTEVPEIRGLVDDLVAAQNERGVDVKLVVGNYEGRNDETMRLLREADIPLTVCTSGCLPNGDGQKEGLMHMKFFTFSDGDQVRVVHTSSNLSDAQLKRHQNLLSVTGDQALYDNYVGFWNRMNVGSWTYDGVEWKGEDRAPLGDAPGLKSYFFPRTEADPVRGTLELLECQDGADRVWASASLFHTDERLPVLKVLDDLESSGCDVRVIVALAEHKEWIDVNSDLDNVRVLDGAGEVWHSHHNKLIVTDALYQGEERHAVYAGSHNLNTGSLRLSSDGMLRVADEAVFNLYADYYEEMYALAG